MDISVGPAQDKATNTLILVWLGDFVGDKSPSRT